MFIGQEGTSVHIKARPRVSMGSRPRPLFHADLASRPTLNNGESGAGWTAVKVEGRGPERTTSFAGRTILAVVLIATVTSEWILSQKKVLSLVAHSQIQIVT